MYKPTRLHPLAAGLSFLKSIKEWVIPLIFFFIVGPGGTGEIKWAVWTPLLFVAFLGARSVMEWYRFTYYIEGGELKIEQGVLIRKKRLIPKNRIQSIDYSAGVFHRIFEAVQINIETAGGSAGSEASLPALKKTDARQLVAILQEDHAVGESDKVQGDVSNYHFTLTAKDLIIAATTSGGLGIALPVVGTVASQFDNLLPNDFFVEAFKWLTSFSWIFIAFMISFTLLIAWFFSIIGIILKYANFTLKRYNDRIVIKRGLFEKRELTLPIQRIQGIRIVESVIRQPFGLATVHVESAGGAGPEQGVSAMLFPIIKRSRINQELKNLIGYRIPEELTSIPRRSKRRYIIRGVTPSVLLLPLFWLLPIQYWITLIIPVGVLVLWGVLRFKDSKGLMDNHSFYLQFRVLSKSLLITERKRMQHIEIRQSFLQRKQKVATLKTAILSSGVGRVVQLRDVGMDYAIEMFHWFSGNKHNGH